MSRYKVAIRKYVALGTLITYLFISLAHIFFLRKSNSSTTDTGPSHYGAQALISAHSYKLHRDHNSHVLFQRVFKSTVQSKRNRSAALLLAVAAFIFIIAKCAVGGLNTPEVHRWRFLVSHQYSYLSFCALRI
jgi:predicted permease